MRLVFMGTPDFAIPSLNRLLASSHTVLGVVTQPDRPSGRGLKVQFSPVKKMALAHGLPLLQPQKLTEPEFLNTLQTWNADCFVVVAFRILPKEVFTMPPKGTINLHASLLPKYRGPAPIQRAILNGEKETGVTTFFIEETVDTGQWILQEKVAIGPEETAGELHDRLAKLGAEVLLQTLDLIEKDLALPHPQVGTPTSAPKIHPEEGKIDWKEPAEKVFNRIRAFSPKPGAYTFWNEKRLKILRASLVQGNSGQIPGTVLECQKDKIIVACGSDAVGIREIQPESKKGMDVDAFLRGHGLKPGMLLR